MSKKTFLNYSLYRTLAVSQTYSFSFQLQPNDLIPSLLQYGIFLVDNYQDLQVG